MLSLSQSPTAPVKVIMMPEFQRGVAVAYCDAPGPLEKGLPTFYAVSPVPVRSCRTWASILSPSSTSTAEPRTRSTPASTAPIDGYFFSSAGGSRPARRSSCRMRHPVIPAFHGGNRNRVG